MCGGGGGAHTNSTSLQGGGGGGVHERFYPVSMESDATSFGPAIFLLCNPLPPFLSIINDRSLSTGKGEGGGGAE